MSTVTTLADTVDFNDDVTSLREAIFAANTVSGADTIEFAPALTAGGPATILLTQGELAITDALTINGPGADLLTIDASGNDPMPDENNGDGSRVFNINDSVSSLVNVEIIGIRLTGGDVAGSGGAIQNVERLTVLDCIIFNNASQGNDGNFPGGGGIDNVGGELLVVRSSISENWSKNLGGGILSRGNGAQSLTIQDSTIDGNVGSGGGGVSVFEGGLTISSTTVSGNIAEFTGGGIYVLGDVEPFNISFSSIVHNKSNSINSALRMGVGLYLHFGLTSTANLDHTIIAQNSSVDGTNNDVFGNVDLRYSILGVMTGAAITDNGGNIVGTAESPVDPQLGPLSVNGGATKTHALLAGSPAIDAGDPAAVAGVSDVPEFDQRGTPFGRVADGDGTGAARIDMGAYERQPGETYQLVVDTLADELDGDYSAGDFSLREAIAIANANPGSDTIEFAAALTAGGPATILLTQGELAITDALTIGGPGADLLTIDASGNDPTPDSTLDDGDDTNDGDGTRVFLIFDHDLSTEIAVEIAGLKLTGGDTGSGGAISSAELLRLREVILSDNSAYEGGAIDQTLSLLTVVDSVISHNMARAKGGGILVIGGSLAVFGSQISFNSTRDKYGDGGGINVENYYTTGEEPASVVIERSVIAYNSVNGDYADGGGLYVNESINDDPVSVRIVGSTIAQNTASGGVAGMFLGGASATIVDSTVSSNLWFGPRVMSKFWLNGGGICSVSSDLTLERSTVTQNEGRSILFVSSGYGIFAMQGGEVRLDHSIVAENSRKGANVAVADILSDNVVSAHASLIGVAVQIVDDGGNLLGTTQSPIDPLLGPIVYNGGPVFIDGSRMLTHALLPGSPAIDAGDPAAVAGVNGVPEFDQRGGPWSRVVGGRIDMGAVEFQPNPLPGDYNFDGIVGAADYTVWRDTLGVANDLRADGSGAVVGVPDGVVDEHDYDFWKANFGNVYEPPAEPGAAGIAILNPLSNRSANQPRALPGVPVAGRYEIFGIHASHNASKPPADPKSGYPAGAVGRSLKRNSFDALRSEALLDWLASRATVKSGDDQASPSLARDESAEAVKGEFCAALDHAFDLLGGAG